MKILNRKNIPTLLKGDIKMVELGVAQGHFSREILQNCPNVHLTMVDRWAGDRGHNNAEMQLAIKNTEFANNRRKIVKKTFEEALKDYEDSYFDIVYIDGYAHTGQEGGKTLKLWFDKLRIGGIFCGHDYHPMWQPTVDVVDNFVQENNLKMFTTEKDQFPSWYAIKII